MELHDGGEGSVSRKKSFRQEGRLLVFFVDTILEGNLRVGSGYGYIL